MNTVIEDLKVAFKEGDSSKAISLSRAIINDPSLQEDANEIARSVMYEDLRRYVEVLCAEDEDEDFDYGCFFDGEGKLLEDCFGDGIYPSTTDIKNVMNSIVVPLLLEHTVTDLEDGQTVDRIYYGLLMKTNDTYWTIMNRESLDNKGNIRYMDTTPDPYFSLQEIVVNNKQVGEIHNNTKFCYNTMSEEFKIWHLYLGAFVLNYLVKTLGTDEDAPLYEEILEVTPF